jgi:archaemetzincin
MMKFKCLLAILLFGCNEKEANEKIPLHKYQDAVAGKKEVMVLVQPFSDFPEKKAEFVYEKLKLYYPATQLLSSIPLPQSSYHKPRNRFRADSLIAFLKSRAGKGQIIVGLTSKDVSTTKGRFNDFGIFGLGFMNGPSCIISSFRLKNNDQLFKTVIHELGHNFGLPHCAQKTCFMRDAEGKNPLDEENGFCNSCTKKLIAAGWLLK